MWTLIAVSSQCYPEATAINQESLAMSNFPDCSSSNGVANVIVKAMWTTTVTVGDYIRLILLLYFSILCNPVICEHGSQVHHGQSPDQFLMGFRIIRAYVNMQIRSLLGYSCDRFPTIRSYCVHMWTKLLWQMIECGLLSVKGDKRNTRGSDARQYLVNLGLLLEKIQFQQDQ